VKDKFLTIVRNSAVRKAFLALVLAVAAAAGISASEGCAAFRPSLTPSRGLCYAAADQAAQARVDQECAVGDAGVPFAECPAHDEIMAQLQAAQEACE
jgi:hypothetical protein